MSIYTYLYIYTRICTEIETVSYTVHQFMVIVLHACISVYLSLYIYMYKVTHVNMYIHRERTILYLQLDMCIQIHRHIRHIYIYVSYVYICVCAEMGTLPDTLMYCLRSDFALDTLSDTIGHLVIQKQIRNVLTQLNLL